MRLDDECLYCVLSDAAHAGDKMAVLKAIERGARPSDDVECNNALAYAIHKGNIDIAQILLDNGADPNRLDPMMRETPVALAVREQATPIVELLLGHGATLNDLDMFGVVRSGAEDFAVKLIELGAPVTMTDPRTGRTLLHDAAMYGYVRTAIALAAAGISLLQVDKWGNTAAELASMNGHISLSGWLDK